MKELPHDTAHRHVVVGTIGLWLRQHPDVVQSRKKEEDGEDYKHYGPRKGNIARSILYQSRYDDKQSLSRYGGNAIECATDANKE